MIKSNEKVTRKTRETYFFHRKPQKLKIAKKIFFENCFRKKNEKFHSVSRIVSKLRKLASYRRNTKIKMFPSQLGKDKSKLPFLRFSLRFYSALVILEPQMYVVVEQFGRKISRCSAGVLFENVLECIKGSLFNCSDILQQNGC